MENSNEIAPRIVDGDPMCSGEECPAYRDGGMTGLDLCKVYTRNVIIRSGDPCAEGLRRRRDALAAEVERLKQRESFAANNVALDKIESLERELDAARRELCAAQGALLSGAHVNPAESYAASRGWAYLYESDKLKP